MTDWKIVRWKPCDGGCCTRSPRFPQDNPTPRDPARPAFHADCRYHLNEPGGISADGSEWRGGCEIYKELLANVATRGGDPTQVTEADLDADPKLTEIRAITSEALRQIHKDGGLQWFMETCWEWPAATPTLTALRERMEALGMIDPVQIGGVIDYATVYTDRQRTDIGQEFHITHDMTRAQRDAEEPACCHVWEPQ